MRRLALVPIIAVTFLGPQTARALGLGEVEMQSALNQRIDAEIPLRGVDADESDDITVTLASEEAFENVGLDRPFSLTRLQFSVEQRDGRHYVQISSDKPIVEPFLSFLIEVEWPGGNLLREYTVLLDPPVFASGDAENGDDGTAPSAASSGGGSASGAGVPGDIERDAADESPGDGTEAMADAGSSRAADDTAEKPVFLQVEEDERASERRAAEDDAGAAGGSGPREYGPVAKGETLWNIAARLKRGDMNVQQMMVALLRYNPEAFSGGNVNRLKQGYVLRVPDAETVRSVSAQRAIAEVREQNGLWREWRDGNRTPTAVAASEQGAGQVGTGAGADSPALSIVGADEGGASSEEAASATSNGAATDSEELRLAREQLESARMEKDELESRVQELEETVAKMQKLLTVRSNELDALENELKQARGEAADEDGGTEVAALDDGGASADGGATDGSAGGDDGAAGTQDGSAGDTAADTDGDTQVAADGSGAADAADTTTASTDTTEAAEAGSDAAATSTDEAATDGEYVPSDKRVQASDRGVQTTRTQEPQVTWLDQVNAALATAGGVVTGLAGGMLAGPVGLAGAAAVLLLVGGLVVARRRRSAEAEDDDTEIGSMALEDGGLLEEADLGVLDDGPGAFAQEGDAGLDDGREGDAGEDVESALMAEQFDMGALDDGDGDTDSAAEAADDPDEGDKDDTIAEADVYLAYGLHQQAEDLLRLAIRENPDNAGYHEKLLETLYGAGNKDEFVEHAETFHGIVDSPQNRLWQRVVAMGKDMAPEHPLFAAGDTEYTAADVQPTRPAATDIELDDGGGDLDLGFDDEPTAAMPGAETAADDDFTSTVMLDAGSGAVEGDAGLVGPEDDAPASATDADSGDSDDSDDFEFDLGDLDDLGGGPEPEPAAADAGERADTMDADGGLEFDLDDFDTTDAVGGAGASATESAPAEAPAPETTDTAAADDGGLDFDLDLGDSPGTAEPSTEGPAPDAGAAQDADGGLDFDFDLGDDEPVAATESTDSAEPAAAPATDDDALDLGALGELGDDESLASAGGASGDEPVTADDTQALDLGELEPATGESAGEDIAEFDLGDLEAGDDLGSGGSGDSAGAEFDLADLESSDDGGSAEAGGAEFDLSDFGTDDEADPSAGAIFAADDSGVGEHGGETVAAAVDAGGDDAGDDDFDTMLDLARAYIDMGDAESATSTLEEVASSGNEQQRNEARSLLESVH